MAAFDTIHHARLPIFPHRAVRHAGRRRAGAGRLQRQAGLPESRHHRRQELRRRLLADRSHRQAPHAGGFPRQGGRDVLRLHALPGRLSDHAGRAARRDGRARQGCRPRAGTVRHRRSAARYAGLAGQVCARFRSALHRPAPGQRPGAAEGRQGLQGVLQQGARQHARQLHDGPHRRQLHVRPEGQPAAVHQAWPGPAPIVHDIKLLLD